MVFFQHHWIQFLLGKERTGINGWWVKYMCGSPVFMHLGSTYEPPLNGSSAVWLVLIRCNLLSLSLGFQLPTFCAGRCSSAVIFFLWGFNCQPYTLVDASSAVIFFLFAWGFNCQPIVLVGAHPL